METETRDWCYLTNFGWNLDIRHSCNSKSLYLNSEITFENFKFSKREQTWPQKEFQQTSGAGVLPPHFFFFYTTH